jgi:hypothetical protein
MRITSTSLYTASGINVGIGTSSPAGRLHVVGTNDQIRGGDGTTTSFLGGSSGNGYTGTLTNHPFLIYTNSAIRATFDSSGNLGLGVTPSAWSSGKAIEVGAVGNSIWGNGAVNMRILSNAYFASGAFRYANSAVASQYAQDNGTHAWSIAPSWNGTGSDAISFTQAMTLDASGSLLIGQTTNTQNYRLVIKGSAGTADDLAFNSDATRAEIQSFNSKPLELNRQGNNVLICASGGNLLVGNTAAVISADNRLTVVGTRGGEFKSTGGAGFITLDVWNNATTGDNIFLTFRTETTDTARGSITYNRAGGLVAYNTTSDYRSKDIFGPVQNSGATIDALKVYEGQMKGASQSRPMLVAHEAQEHAPYAVTGEKDAVNEDGTPKYQQMDVSALVPLLLAEIQSLRARVAQLESK